MVAVGKTDVGKVRTSNQDRVFVRVLEKERAYAVVCDGMGGHAGGEVASELASECIREGLDRIREGASAEEILLRMTDAVKKANRKVFAEGLCREELRGMGSTAVVAYLCGRVLLIAHVGDSRAYLFGADGTARQLTQDHSLMQEMIDRGEILQEQSEKFPYKNLITRAVGIEPEVRVDTGVFDWHDGDTVLLCSDGLSNTVKLPQMQAILAEEKADGSRACRRLIDLANRNGGPDNITVAVLKTDEE